VSIIRSLGHLLLSGIFISGGAHAFMEPGGRVNKVAGAGIPEPKLAVEFNGAVMVIAGTSLGMGIAPKSAAAIPDRNSCANYDSWPCILEGRYRYRAQ
jgi:putative oxidoreductase